MKLDTYDKYKFMQREDVFFVIPGGFVPMTEMSNIQRGGFSPSMDGNKKALVACACALALENLYRDDAHACDDCLMFLGWKSSERSVNTYRLVVETDKSDVSCTP